MITVAALAVLLVAARAHREHRGDCAEQQPRASRDYCGAPADPAEVSGRVASPSDGALRGARDAPAPRIAQAGVAMPRGWRRSEWLAPKPSSVLYAWQRTFDAPLVWRLDNYVGLGNALDAYARAAIEASHRKRRLKWTCLARRLRAARLGCGAGDRVFVAADSAVVKRRFAAALRTAFPGVAVGYFDGLAPPIYDTWLKAEPTPSEWLLLAAAAADWLALARSAHVLGLKGTTTGLALPSSFARTATLAFSPASFENLQRLVWSRDDRRVACCVWKDDGVESPPGGRAGAIQNRSARAPAAGPGTSLTPPVARLVRGVPAKTVTVRKYLRKLSDGDDVEKEKEAALERLWAGSSMSTENTWASAAARGPVVSSDRIDEGVGSSDSSDEGCAGCAKCVTKDALLARPTWRFRASAKLSTPGAAWAKTVEALPNRTQGMAKKGLALMARLEPTSTPRNGGPDGSGSDDDSSDDPEPPRPRRRVTAARVDEPSAGPATEAKARDNDDVRLDTFAGRCTKKVKIVTVQVDSDGRRTLVVKEEHHQRHTKHAGDLEIYQAFLKSAGYASHLAAHPSHKISFTLFKRAKCPCIAV
ncbi:LSM domain-containing protein [Aureococcus anophagefferens]|nr:LSM domain-containing protein [Aureococcus anophagefferens]